MIMGSLDLGGSLQFLNLALTSLLLRVFVFFMLRHGVGMQSFTSSSGLSAFLILFKSKSDVYSSTKDVS